VHEATRANMEKATRSLNYAINLVQWADSMVESLEKDNIDSDDIEIQNDDKEKLHHEITNLYISAEKKIKESRKGFSSLATLNEIEILCILTSLKIHIYLRSYYEIKAELANLNSRKSKFSSKSRHLYEQSTSKSTDWSNALGEYAKTISASKNDVLFEIMNQHYNYYLAKFKFEILRQIEDRIPLTQERMFSVFTEGMTHYESQRSRSRKQIIIS
jgi:hypothetical protein